ncbi:hypothetical protein V0U79_07420 [Hyphobacterium sp. HN65]|uniref:Uncharacterized protein n=1 Tax=Hyphobacterium lacteum TaxID=3116575 RepID=A0ABU7LQL1_9PROT|nr:hypothetical protein [Hyphobacterium sp. HN65]MEE2526192.1 hypothetical protein [Hyphobacterium sp. HN65]
MKYFTAAIIALGLAASVQADHHGRGQEQLNGFPGIYRAGFGTFTFTGDGYLSIVVNSSNVTAAIYRYSIDEGVMALRDISPPAFFPEEQAACALDNDGVYEITDRAGGFTFTLIEDPCPARVNLINGRDLDDYVRPE